MKRHPAFDDSFLPCPGCGKSFEEGDELISRDDGPYYHPACEPPEPTLDLTDPAVLAMARTDHEPRESWSMGGRLQSVACRTCGQTWPCPTILAVRGVDGA